MSMLRTLIPLVTKTRRVFGKKVSGTFCAKHPKGEFLVKGTGHLFLEHLFLELRSNQFVASFILVAWVGLLVTSGGCAQLRLPAIDPTGACVLAPLPTTTSFALPCMSGDGCTCLGCVRGLGSCLRCPGFTSPVPAFTQPADPPECLDNAVGCGVDPNEPCVPGPGCSGECAVGPPAVLYGSEIYQSSSCKLHKLPQQGERGCILLTPQKIVAPVGGEVMLLSGICGTDGYLQIGEPLEWMLSRDSVGNIIAVGDDDPGVLHRLAKIPVASKEDAGFARGVTSSKEQLITRGNQNPADDVKLEKGQTWLTLSSASEGSSHITVLAPDSDCWDQRKATATIYWVDARWQFPAPQRVAAGTPVELLTRVTRAEGSIAARGWKVRYEILNPGLATFAGTTGSTVVEVNVDDSGNAVATLVPTPGTSGNSVVDIRVIRPGGTSDSMPDLTLGRGQAYVTWSSPQLTLRAGGPEVASYEVPFEVYANIANPGDQDATGVRVEVAIPQGVKVIAADAFAKVFTTSVVWDIGTIPPQQQLDLSLQLSSSAPMSLGFQARGDNGLIAEQVVRVDVYRPALLLRVRPEVERVTEGDSVRFAIEVENTGDRALQNVALMAIGDNAMVHPETRSNEIGTDKTDGPLQPGGIWNTNVTFIPTDAGLRCINVTATAAGGQQAKQQSCVTVLNAPPATPAITTKLNAIMAGDRDRAVVGDPVLVRGLVENTGRVPLTNVRVTMAHDPTLVPIRATEDYPRRMDAPYVIAWTIAELAPGRVATLETEFRAEGPAARSQIIFNAESAEGARGGQQTDIQIMPGAAAPTGPLTAPPTLPPAQTPPAIPNSPAPTPQTTPAPPVQPTVPPPARQGALRLGVLQQDLSPRVGDNIRYSLAVINETNLIDSAVQIAFDLPPGVTVERLAQSTSPELGQITRSGNTIYFEEIKTIKPGETIDYTLVLRSNQPQTFNLVFEAVSRNYPAGISVNQPTEVTP